MSEASMSGGAKTGGSDKTKTVTGRSLGRDAWHRLLANKGAVVAMLVLAFMAGFALVAPLVAPFAMEDMDLDAVYRAPALATGHWFGTDPLGRDMLVRAAEGARISLLLGLLATLVSLVIGISWGAVAGYMGGRVDTVMMRIVDILYSLPFMFFVILLMAFFERSIILIFIALGAVEWLTMARIVRGQTLALKEREFVEAAVAIGVPTGRIIRRHIIPNLIGPVIVYATLTIPQVILIESFLSFLGLGVQEPMTSLGVLIKQGADEMEAASWLLIVPGVMLAATLFAFNFLGDGLRDALDPQERGR